MRETIPIYVRVDPQIARDARAYCDVHDLALSAFVENALRQALTVRLALKVPNAKTKTKAK